MPGGPHHANGQPIILQLGAQLIYYIQTGKTNAEGTSIDGLT